MIIRRRKRQVPGLNTASTADISFMLLIFFLVTTSMDVDKGLFRMLPSPESKKDSSQETLVDKTTLMALHITSNNQLLLNDQPIEISRLQTEIVKFVKRLGTKHLISIESDRDANYDLYFQMQNEIVLAYKQIRNEYSEKHYGKSFDSLTNKEKDAVRKACPQRITESYANTTALEDKSIDENAEEKDAKESKTTNADNKKGGQP